MAEIVGGYSGVKVGTDGYRKAQRVGIAHREIAVLRSTKCLPGAKRVFVR